MAISYTIPNSFAALTLAESAKVNQNESYTKDVFDGLEAKTKTFSNLGVDATPTSSTDVAIKSYVDKLNSYRRPNLQYSSGTVVNIETGINGTSGQAQILFPDGTLRTDSTTTRINCNFAQTAALSGTAQSGIRSGSVASNTAYAIYAVKVSDSSTDFVTVADTVYPTQSNYSTLNSNFGSNSWVYLGTVRYGDQSGSGSAIPIFSQSGSLTIFQNNCTGNAANSRGIRMATTASATSLTYNLTSGTSGATIPTHLLSSNLLFTTVLNPPSAVNMQVFDNSAAGFRYLDVSTGGVMAAGTVWMTGISAGSQALFLRNSAASANAMDIYLSGWIDPVLGVGANPIL